MGTNISGASFATSLTYRAGDWMNVNQERLKLANTVTGNETPEELVKLHTRDKALTLQGEKAKIAEDVGYALLEASQKSRQKRQGLRERLMGMGAVFA